MQLPREVQRVLQASQAVVDNPTTGNLEELRQAVNSERIVRATAAGRNVRPSELTPRRFKLEAEWKIVSSDV